MAWPAWYRLLGSGEAGSIYVEPSAFPGLLAAHGKSGQAWKFRKTWTTYRPNRKIAYKSLQKLNPQSEEDFWHIMDSCRGAGVDPPTSFADIFTSVYRHRFPLRSILAPFFGSRFGGWQEALRTGSIEGPVYWYDINKAYRWSACQGLPRMETAFPTLDFTEPCAIYLVDVHQKAIPWSGAKHAGVQIVTSEMRDALDVCPLEILYGVGFRDRVSLSPVFSEIDKRFPWCNSRISRAFWGLWNGNSGPEVWTWKSGEKSRDMRNPWYNPIWAAFITSRIKLRMWQHHRSALHVFIDSILSREELPTGDKVGDFRLVNQFASVWIRFAGWWGSGNMVVKHSGCTKEDLPKILLKK